MGCLSKCQQWLPPPHPGSAPVPGSLRVPQLSPLPSHGCPRSGVLGNLAAARADLSSPALGGQASVLVLPTSRVQCSQSPPVSPPVPRASNQPRGFISPVQDPRTGVSNLRLSLLIPQGRCPATYSPFSSKFPSRSTSPNLIVFLPFLLDYICIFLTALVV